jgi:xanthine dehydrogenase accessory factor
VEGAVVTEALDVLATGTGRMVTFGYSDDDAFAVGLTCGGTVHLFIEPFDGNEALHAAVREHRPAVLATVVDGPGAGDELLLVEGQEPAGQLADPDLHRVVLRDAEAALAAATTSVRRYGACGEANEDAVTVFFEAYAPPPRLLIFGAVDFTAALARVAKVLGYRVTVCDAREVFATKRRFPMADEVVVEWPNRLLERVGPTLGPRDAVCVLTHDPKFDIPVLTAALRMPLAYVGAMGSRRTHEERARLLVEAGVSPDQLARLRSPLGLDLGARTPEETALSIAAEIVAHRNRATGLPLTGLTGPIHARLAS